MNFSKTDFITLTLLATENTIERKALSLEEIKSLLKEKKNHDVSIHTIRKSISMFKITGLVKEGLFKSGEKGNAKTYYITEKGKEVLAKTFNKI